MDNIDPRRLRIYGNGGGQLPFNNSKFRYDDLQENAILVQGENDGVFDNTDFVLFFATAQTRWKYDGTGETFSHQLNGYSDSTYYFITTDLGSGKRIQHLAEASGTPNQTVSTYNDYQFIESELVNLLKSGREWYGESLDNLNSSRSYNFSFPNLVTSEQATFRANMIARAVNGSSTTNRVSASLSGISPIVTYFNNVGTSPQDNYALPISFNQAFLPLLLYYLRFHLLQLFGPQCARLGELSGDERPLPTHGNRSWNANGLPGCPVCRHRQHH